MCHRIRGHERVNSVEVLMAVFTQQTDAALIEANSVPRPVVFWR